MSIPGGNMYAALETVGNDIEKRGNFGNKFSTLIRMYEHLVFTGSRSKEPYNSKGPSLERNYKPSYEGKFLFNWKKLFNECFFLCVFVDGRGSRSGSQHRPQDNSMRNVPITTPTPIQQNIVKVNPPPPNKSVPVLEDLNAETEQKIFNILEEYQNDLLPINECDEDIKTMVPPSLHVRMVSDWYAFYYVNF